jgi:pre-mRNA cleavage complex 2 protein Pcf11
MFPAPQGSSLWMSQEKAPSDIGLDPRVSRFANQPAGHYSGRSSQDGVTSVSTRSAETSVQQRQRYWSSSPPPAHSPSSVVPFAQQRSPSPAETDPYPCRSFSQLSQNPQEEYSQRALPGVAKDSHALPIDSTPISSDLTSTSNLLTGLLKSGFKPNNGGDLASLQARPLVPAGPLPNTLPSMVASSSLRSSAIENAPLQAQGPNSSRPPLPPGLPPSPSIVSSTQLVDNAAPLSSLLSSLVKKGLISSPTTDSPVTVSKQPSKLLSANTTDTIASVMSLPIVKPPVVDKETPTPDSSALVNPLLPKIVEIKTGDLIGLEFKPDKLRKCHKHVIGSLFDDQSHQCKTCGERFRLEEELRLHMTCRGSRESENIYAGIAPRRWYPSQSSYIHGSHEMESNNEVFAASDADLGSTEELCEFMVPADETQIICALCGDPFDDIYSIESSEWMFKDAVLLDYSKGEDSSGNRVEGENEHVPIVHAKCMPRSLKDGMEVD